MSFWWQGKKSKSRKKVSILRADAVNPTLLSPNIFFRFYRQREVTGHFNQSNFIPTILFSGRQTYGCSGCICTHGFSASPWSYIYISKSVFCVKIPHFNLLCTHTFWPRLAQLIYSEIKIYQFKLYGSIITWLLTFPFHSEKLPTYFSLNFPNTSRNKK